MWFLLALSSAFFYGASAPLSKISTGKLNPIRALFYYGIFSCIIYFIIWMFFGVPFHKNLLIPIITEVCAVLGFVFYYIALEKSMSSLMVTFTSSYILISILIGICIFGDKLHTLQSVGVPILISGIFLLGLHNKKSDRKDWLLPSIFAVIFWGIWGGLSGKAVAIAGPFNVTLIFGIAAVVIWTPLFFLKRGNPPKENKKGILFSLFTALVMDAGGIAFYSALKFAPVSLVVPVSNLYPSFGIIFGLIIGERPTRIQLFAFIPVLIGLFLVSR